ncbi:MAG: alpha/beta hydrolase [Gaiellaceae bacterium]
MRLRLLALFALCAALAAVPAAGRGSGSVLVQFSFKSHALKRTLRLEVYLPAGYETSGLRYPVVYFLHGLPAGPNAYKDVAWLRGALDTLSPGVILVAPQGSTKADSDPEYLDWGPGADWETAVAKELPAYVDAHLRTIPARTGRALVGLSAGGYGAVILALHHLDSFAAVESWSGYFRPTNPAGTATLDLGSDARNAQASAHALVLQLRADEQKRPTFFAFYVGLGDTRFRAENEELDRELNAALVPHVFVLYPGAHERTVWASHAAAWLALAAAHLAVAT